MTNIDPNDQGFIEKHLFSFLWRDSMQNPVFMSVSIIPVEAGAIS